MSEEATLYDYLIVGAGIAGTTLALELWKRGKRVGVIDNGNPHSSSRVAAGMMNPMVPRNVQKAWKCDEIYPQVFSYYENWEQHMGARFIHRIPTLQVHKNASHTKNWERRSKEKGFQQHLSPVAAQEIQVPDKGIPLPFGGAVCHLSGKLDVSEFLLAAYSFFEVNGIHKLDLHFKYEDLHFENGHWNYGNLVSTHMVFAEGIGLYQNPYFNFLPLGATGGDILELEIPHLQEQFILKRKEWLIPIGNSRWLGGSTYHNEDLSTEPHREHAEALMSLFQEWIPQKITLIQHRRAARPTVATWRPFLGTHHQHPNMHVYNGLGSKGSSLVSYLSPQFAEHLCTGLNLSTEVDISRFFS
jgi:glycine oxidase